MPAMKHPSGQATGAVLSEARRRYAAAVMHLAKPNPRVEQAFATVPREVSEMIREETDGRRGGFGSVKVAVRIGETDFSTSVFPDSKSRCFVLPVKKAVRRTEEIEDGDPVEITLRLFNVD